MSQAWNKPTHRDDTQQKSAKKSTLKKGVLAGFITIAALAGTVYFIFGGKGQPALQRQEVPAKIKDVALPDRQSKMSPQTRAKRMLKTGDRGHIEAPTTPPPVPTDPRFPYTDGRKVIRSFTNSWGQVIDRCIMPNGKRRKVIRNLRKPVFETATDQILAMATGSAPDEPGPPIPFDENMEDAFLDSLKIPIVIKDDDSDEVKAAKERVKAAREQMIEGIANGGTFYNILNEHIKAQHENAETKEIVMQTVRELKESGDSGLLESYLKEANKVLGNLGASPVSATDGNEEEGENE